MRKLKKEFFRLLHIFKLTLSYYCFCLTKPFRQLKKECGCDSLRCESDFGNISYRYSSVGKNSPVCCLSHLYELIKWVDGILKKHDIEYMIAWGTLLGAIRHKGFIPWDTDVDLAIHIKDREIVMALLEEEIKQTHYHLNKGDHIFFQLEFSEKNRLHIDFYFFDIRDDTFFTFDYIVTYKTNISTIYPLKEYAFYDLMLPGPAKFDMFREYYGDDVLEKAYRQSTLFGKYEEITDFSPGIIG